MNGDAMNGTPRLRSAYPDSPWRKARSTCTSDGDQRPEAVDTRPAAAATPNGNSRTAASGDDGKPSAAPLIPLTLLDAPTQRCYVAAIYVVLLAWRLVDYSLLISNDIDSPWQWMKWTVLDGVFLFGVPELRIPWLEWSSSTIAFVFLIHATINGILMFRIPIPFEAWIVAITRMVYDRELAVSERRVKPGSLAQHATLITGKQIVHILPEGTAMLNPHHVPLCIDQSRLSATIPIFINQTEPIAIELLRIDLESNANETIQISTKEARRMKKQADRELKKPDSAEPRILHYPVKKTGLYRLTKMVDESKLEVQRINTDTLVVPCPYGMVKLEPPNKCHGELSNFSFQISAIPPLKIKYRKTVNDGESSNVQLTVHPDHLDSPLARSGFSQALVKVSSEADLSWAQAHEISVPVNETLGIHGSWKYFLEEIRDGCGNVVNYTRSDDSKLRHQRTGVSLEQTFQVHQRPGVAFQGCSAQHPLKIARGKKSRLPIVLNPSGQRRADGSEHRITYSFAAQNTGAEGNAFTEDFKPEQVVLRSQEQGPEIDEPGIYRLDAVATEFCSGEVFEPSQCVLTNPPEPDVSISSDNIPHQCAGNSVGLRVDLDMIGTPPFLVSYSVQRRGEKAVVKQERISGMRTQLEFRPQDAGFYTYEILQISDSIYTTGRSLRAKQLQLEQDVKPTALARFIGHNKVRACIGDTATFQIQLTGDAPWTLDYDLIYQGKRTKNREKDIGRSPYTLTTPKLTRGGQYTVSLTSVTDSSGCKIFLDQGASVDVRHNQPGAAFGQIEGESKILTLQGKQLSIPLRLSGEGPWDVTVGRKAYRGVDEQTLRGYHMDTENARLPVDLNGIYTLESVSDRSCPGVVDASASDFEVEWIERPSLALSGTTPEGPPGLHRKAPVCEGEQDSTEFSFGGTPPYHIKYKITKRLRRGQVPVVTRSESIGLSSAAISMDTSQAGSYEYEITELSDQLYDHDRRHFAPIVIKQQVNPLPSADFSNSGKTYSYCKEDNQQDETIPISLTGTPPFAIEIGIRHHASAKPDIIPIPRIESNRYDFRIPHKALTLGSHIVSIRRVSDANGCQKHLDMDGPGVRVNVVDVPSISPMEQWVDFCVGDRISYTLAGTPPFNVFYTFENVERKATSSTNSFRRIAEKPGNFTITAVSDKTSTDACKARTEYTKTIHELPSVHMSKGSASQIDIHEGGEAELTFEFGGTPPFEFTYTRSTNSARGQASRILETKTEVSTEMRKTIRVSEEGTYEVVSVRDRYCAVSTQRKKSSDTHLLTFNNK